MKKNRLLLLPLIIGIVLMVYSCFLSCPLSYDSLTDFIFNHISVIYGIGLPLACASAQEDDESALFGW